MPYSHDWIILKKHISSIILAALCTLPLASCVAPIEPNSKPTAPAIEEIDPASNQDPTKGWVKVIDDSEGAMQQVQVYKRCDGRVLIYMTPGYSSGAHGIAAIDSNSNTECNR